MEDKRIFEDSKLNQKCVNDILSIIKGYEVNVEVDNECGRYSFDCNWKSSGLRFHLGINQDFGAVTQEKVTLNVPNIFILVHNGNDEDVLEKVQTFDNSCGYLVIFDANEDIQVFSKDIWNLLVYLNDSGKNGN